MNYKRIYEQLIQKRKQEFFEGYGEKHHIIPRCMGGTNKKENIVRLTAREHFIAHALLCKIYPNEYKLLFAFNCMINKWGNKAQQRNYKISSNVYAYCKNNYSQIVSQRMIGKQPWNKGLKGVCSQWNEQQRKEISKRNSGSGNGMFGRKQSQKCKDAVSKAHKGISQNEEWRFKGKKKGKDHARYGKHWGPDYAYKIAITKCYKQLLRYNNQLIDESIWDTYKLSIPVQNVSKQTIFKQFGTFQNMVDQVNFKYNTHFQVI